MGIKGLWRALKSYVQDGHLGQFRGQRVAVDMYVWLHQATRGCVVLKEEALVAHFESRRRRRERHEELGNIDEDVTVEEVATLRDTYIGHVVSRVESLQRFGIIPVCVFDGADIPMKQGTNEERGQLRAQCFRDALEKLEMNYLSCVHTRGGGTGSAFQPHAASYTEALGLLERALDISTEVAHPILQVLKEERHIECFVAPYEADAELAYLTQTGYVHAALSEDSDLVAYYCPCVISKADLYTGRCDVLRPEQSVPSFFLAQSATGLSSRATGTATISAPSHPPSVPPSSETPAGITSGRAALAPVGFTYESFLLGCVMAGCDYAKNLTNIGIVKAFKLVSHSQSLPELLSLLQTQFGFPAETVRRYQAEILKAFYCFAHHIVYCPVKKKTVNLHPLPAHVSGAAVLKTELVGVLWPDDVARKVCEECLYDPVTLAMYRGTYMGALQRYLQRTRRGQVSLTSFKAFSGLSSAKVVVQGPSHSAHIKREREDMEGFAVVTAGGSANDHPWSRTTRPDTASGLRKVQEASGFLGSESAHPAASAARTRAVVRSKYFLRSDGRQGVMEDWSASTSDTTSSGCGSPRESTGEEGDTGAEPITARALTRGGAGSFPHGLSTPALSELTLGADSSPTLPPPPSSSLLGISTPPPDAAGEKEARASRSPQPLSTKCLCPFGYSQCNTAHSIFLKCFQGKSWTKRATSGDATGVETQDSRETFSTTTASAGDGEGGGDAAMGQGASSARTSTLTAGTPDPPCSTVAYPASPTYQCAGFKPPRSLGHRAEESKGTTSAESKPPVSTSIFDKLAFKK